MMRIALAVAVFIAGMISVLAFDLRPAPAAEAPWCAVVSVGFGDVVWDCQYRSVEECRPNVLAGNRGTCNQNPRWDGWYTAKTAPKTHKKRHPRRH